MKNNLLARLLAVLILLTPLSLHAQLGSHTPPPRGDHAFCATGQATQERVEALDRWVRARNQRLAKQGRLFASPAASRVENDMILMEATPSILPFHHTLDLRDRSLTFVPDGDDSFLVSNTSLDYDADVGEKIHTFSNNGQADWSYRVLDLSDFDFPLGASSYSRLYITAHNGIHFDVPSLGLIDQFTLLEALSLDGPVVAPLLQTDQGTIFPLPEIWVKESADAVTITWRSGPSEWGFALDVQARLESTGKIVFSYRTIDEFEWGTVLVTSGSEPWRESRELLHTEGAPWNGVNGSVRQMLDVRQATIERIGNSNLLELTIKTYATIRPTSLAPNQYLTYFVEFFDPSGGGDWIDFYITRDEMQYRTPESGWSTGSPAAEFDGNTIRMRFLQGSLNLIEPTVTFTVATFISDSEPSVDVLSGTTSLGSWTADFDSDLSEVAAGTTVSGPILEPFTLGAMNTNAVWSAVSSTYGFEDEYVDGVAIFQDFYTDIVLYAGAYSTVGNPGADGVSRGSRYGTQYPRSPALLHMNRAGYRWNADLPRSYHVLSHELGHRWLYFIDIDQGGGASDVLRPLGGHPAQYVHTPAAFKVYTDRDSSTMGGSDFTDNANGTFSTPEEYGYYGYSWHDLYLMGLAAPEEVEDWYYISNTSPPLGGAYNPPPGITVSGTQRNVDLDDVVRAMGTRNPTVATSQKRFKVVFVLLSLPGTSPSLEVIQQLDEQRKWFERTFGVATGHRGEIDTTLIPVRRRGVRHP